MFKKSKIYQRQENNSHFKGCSLTFFNEVIVYYSNLNHMGGIKWQKNLL